MNSIDVVIGFHKMWENFLTILEPVSSSRRTLLHGVSQLIPSLPHVPSQANYQTVKNVFEVSHTVEISKKIRLRCAIVGLCSVLADSGTTL
jgi:hypothetical protein